MFVPHSSSPGSFFYNLPPPNVPCLTFSPHSVSSFHLSIPPFPIANSFIFSLVGFAPGSFLHVNKWCQILHRQHHNIECNVLCLNFFYFSFILISFSLYLKLILLVLLTIMNLLRILAPRYYWPDSVQKDHSIFKLIQ